MCGIAGVAAAEPLADAADIGTSLARALAHRGPDAEGFWASGPDGSGLCTAETLTEPANVVLVHRRLSIVDLDGGQQPMANEDGTVWTVFNGEIYNHMELRRELEAAGHVFKTSCDTEVIIHGFEQWGDGVLGRLNGIFAIALLDRRRAEILLARDPVGVKPLYVGVNSRLLWWSSEVSAAVGAGLTSTTISRDALRLFFLFRFIPSPYSIYESTWKVPPGHYLRIPLGERTPTSLAFRPFEPQIRSSAEPRSRAEWREALLDELQGAIDRQLMADVRVGSLLSGGVDSSLITATMAAQLPYRPMTFGIGFRSTGERSEAVAARFAATALDVPHRSLELTESEYLVEWPESFARIGEPLANGGGLLVFLLCRLAGQDHKVVLTGQGADEPLGGYSRHVVERMYGLSRMAPALLPTLARSLVGSEASSRLERALEQRDRLDRFMNIFAGMDASTVDRLVPGGEIPVRDLARAVIGRWVSANPQPDSVNDLLRVDVRMALADDLLLIADHHSMRASVELRVPFLDLRFLELAERMPSRYKISWLAERKWLYRQGAAARLPPQLRRKVCGPVARVGRKQGFAAPLTAWFAGGAERARVGSDWASALRSLPELSHDVALELVNMPDDGKHARRSVSLYALTQWMDAYGPGRVASRC